MIPPGTKLKPGEKACGPCGHCVTEPPAWDPPDPSHPTARYSPPVRTYSGQCTGPDGERYGRPGVGGRARLYDMDECTQALGGDWQPDGQCFKNGADGSWGWDCRHLNKLPEGPPPPPPPPVHVAAAGATGAAAVTAAGAG
eukprot:SAG22_NODE_1006_length_6075_cov_8.885207_1_plen_140_part_10